MDMSSVQAGRIKSAGTGAAYIADFLIRQRVPYIFGLCGHGILGLLDGLFDRQDEIKTISVHHESAAAFMADAYFRVKQQPLATFTSCEPGSTNLIVAVAAASPTPLPCSTSRAMCPLVNGTAAPSRRLGNIFKATLSM